MPISEPIMLYNDYGVGSSFGGSWGGEFDYVAETHALLRDGSEYSYVDCKDVLTLLELIAYAD